MNALRTSTRHSPAANGPALPEALGEVFFADAAQLVAGRIDTTWRTPRSDEPTWVTQVLRGLAPGERAVAAFSFEPDRPAVAHRISPIDSAATTDSVLTPQATTGMSVVAAALQPRPDAPAGQTPRKHWVREHPETSQYADLVREALSRIHDGAVEKVVLGRCLEVLCDPPMTAREVLHQLAGGTDGTPAGRYLYAVPTGDPAADTATLVGASPELLLRRRGDRVESMPLAGSLPRRPGLDRSGATHLLMASVKDRAEHQHVVTDLQTRLGQVCEEVEVHDVEVIATDSMWHLATRITARLRPASLDDPDCSALALARLVHPTPAVGGVPSRTACDLIADLEPTPRGWFGGAVGWIEAGGDGEFALTLRSGLLRGAALDLWAGAGIVAGSDPDTEVAETGAKLSTMTAAVGL